MPAPAPEGEVLWSAPGHVVARWHQLFLQVRAAEMTPDALAGIEMAGRLLRAQMKRHAKIGVLFLVAPGAPPPRWETARRQRELIRSLDDDPRLYVAAVIEGDNIGALAQRAVMRTIFRSKQRAIHGDLVVAAQWLGRVLGAPHEPSALVAYVESVRYGI